MPSEQIQALKAQVDEIHGASASLAKEYRDAQAIGDAQKTDEIYNKLSVLDNAYKEQSASLLELGKQREAEIFSSLKNGSGAGYEWRDVPAGYEPGDLSTTPKQFRVAGGNDILRSNLAEAYGIPPEKLDVTSGADGNTQMKAAFLGGDESKVAQFLSRNFDAVQPVEINNKTNFLAKKKDGTFLLVNQPDVKWKDAYAAVLPEVIPTVFSIAAGAATTAAAVAAAPETLGASLYGNAWAAPVTSSAAYALGKGAQTALASDLLGTDIKPMGIVKQSGIDFGGGVLAGRLLDKAFRVGGSLAAKPEVNLVEQNLADAIKQTEKAGMKLQMPAGAFDGVKGIETWGQRAMRFPSTALGKMRDKTLNTFANWQKGLLGGGPTQEAVREEIVQSLKQQNDELVSKVAGNDQTWKNTFGKFVQDRLDRVTLSSTDSRTAGEAIEAIREAGASEGVKIKDAAFKAFFAKSDQAGAGIRKGEIADLIDAARHERPDIPNPALENYAQNLRADPDTVIPSGRIRDIQQLISAQIPSGYTVQHPSAQIASASAKKLGDRFESMLAPLKDINGNSLLDEWKSTVDTFKKTDLAFRVGSAGAVGAETMGFTKLAPTEMVEAVLKNEKTVGDFLLGLHNVGKPELAEQAQRIFQSEYLKRIGAAGTSDSLGSELTHTPEMVDALFGRLPDGTVNPLKTQRMLNALDSVNEVLKMHEITPSNIQAGDVERVMGALSEQEKKAAIKVLEDRAILDGEVKKTFQNKLFKKVKQGNWELVDTGEFAKNALTATPREFENVFNEMPIRAKEGLKQDMVAQLFQKFASKQGAREAPNGVQLWDAPAVMEVVGNWTRGGKTPAPKLIKNLDTALGPEFTDAFIGASRQQSLMTFKELAQDTAYRSGIGGNGFWSSISLPIDATWNYVLAASYNKGLEPLLRGMARNLPQQELDKLAQRASNSAWKTTLGMKSLYQVSRNNPDASASLQEEFRKRGVQNIPANAIGEQK